MVDIVGGGGDSGQEQVTKLGFCFLLPHRYQLKIHIYFQSCSLKPKMNIFVPFFVCPYDAFNICEKGKNIWSWIIEHLLMHEKDDAHVLLSDQGISCYVFYPSTFKYA